MAKGQKSQLVTKKHLARQERERIQTRYILIGSIAIIIIVVALVGYGIISQFIIQPQQPVAKVANNAITTKQFQTFARYERLQLINQYQQYQQFAQYFGNDATSTSYLQQYLAEINYQLEPEILGQSALDYLIEDRLIQTEAEKLGITVSEEEVDKKIDEYFGYFPEGTPTTKPTTNPVPTSTLNPTQVALVPPTSTPLPTSTTTPTPVITVTQEITAPTPTVAVTPTVTVATSTPVPTPTPYTLSAFQDDFKTYMTSIKSFAELDEADFRWIFEMQLLREKVYEAVTGDVASEQDQVWARHIVVSDEAQAQAIYDRLAAGEDFMAVATEVYTGTTSTSDIDLGWFGIGNYGAEVDSVLFNQQIGQISEPMQTANGWEVFQVLGHEVRTLTDTQLDQLKQTKFQSWLDQQRSTEDVQTFEIWKARVPAKPTIPPTQPVQ